MDAVSIFYIVLGASIIAGRGPIAFAPSATLELYNRLLLATNARARTFGVVIGGMALCLLLLPFGVGALAGFLRTLGWLSAAATVGILVAPGTYRNIASRVLDYLQSSISETVLRCFGLIAIAFGIALIVLGINLG